MLSVRGKDTEGTAWVSAWRSNTAPAEAVRAEADQSVPVGEAVTIPLKL